MDTATELSREIGLLISAKILDEKHQTAETANYLEQCHAAVAAAIEHAIVAGACRIK